MTILEFQNPHTTGGGRQQPPMETPAAAMVMLENSTPAIAGSQEDFLAVIQLLKDLILDPMSEHQVFPELPLLQTEATEPEPILLANHPSHCKTIPMLPDVVQSLMV